MNRKWLIALLLIAVLAAAAWLWVNYGKTLVEQYIAKEPASVNIRPVALLTPFNSYSSVAEVSSVLDERQLSFSIEQLDASLGKSRPRERHILTAENYEHHGVQGRITLNFLNNQLYETVFEPADIAAYADIMRSKMRLRPNPALNGRTEQVNGAQRIASNVYFANSKVGRSLRTQPFILWQDRRLAGTQQQ